MRANLEVAKENFALAGVQDKIEVRLGKAAHLLQEMIEKGEAPFDLIFIDADKENCTYLEYVLKLSSPGTIILSDNLLPKGEEIGGTPSPKNEKKRRVGFISSTACSLLIRGWNRF